MKPSQVARKLKTLGSASAQNAESLLTETKSTRAKFLAVFDAALAAASCAPARGERADLQGHLREAIAILRTLGQYSFNLFPSRRLKQFDRKLDTLNGNQIAEIAGMIRERQELQASLLTGVVPQSKIPSVTYQLRAADTRLAAMLAPRSERMVTAVNNAIIVAIANTVHALIQPIGWGAEQLARPLKASNRWYTGGRVTRAIGTILEGFFSRDSLARTGFETSWGIRFVIPGTVGFLGNAGPWLMAYTGQLRDYQAMAVPFRINPGATVATDLATFTWNRPGFGVRPTQPWCYCRR